MIFKEHLIRVFFMTYYERSLILIGPDLWEADNWIKAKINIIL